VQGSEFSFLVLALIPAFARQQVKTKYRSGITQAQGYLPHVVIYDSPMKTLNSDYLAPKQLFKVTNCSGDFACDCDCVEFCFHLIACACACFASKSQANVTQPLIQQVCRTKENKLCMCFSM